MRRGLKIEILSLSASDQSVSRACVSSLIRFLNDAHHESNITDIRDLPPIWSSNVKVPNLPEPYTNLFRRVKKASGVIFCVPVYCYATSGAAKTISEVLGGQGGALTRKPVAFVVASGTIRSHLAARDLMSSMAFEQFTFCYPRHVGANAEDLTNDGKAGLDLHERLRMMVMEFTAFCEAINGMKHTHKVLEPC